MLIIDPGNKRAFQLRRYYCHIQCSQSDEILPFDKNPVLKLQYRKLNESNNEQHYDTGFLSCDREF